jgi:hypothetical protein
VLSFGFIELWAAGGGADWSGVADCANAVAPIAPPNTRVERPKPLLKFVIMCVSSTEGQFAGKASMRFLISKLMAKTGRADYMIDNEREKQG